MNYLKETAAAARKVYDTVINLHCKHESNVYSLQEMLDKKIINCAAAMSIALQEAGCLKEGIVINHAKGCGLNGVKLKEKKPSIDDCMSGYESLEHCDIVRVDELYKNLPEEYRKAGVCYIYDSNCAVSAGNGFIYSCNNGLFQFNLKKQYRKNKMQRGYCFTHSILYCIIPKDRM